MPKIEGLPNDIDGLAAEIAGQLRQQRAGGFEDLSSSIQRRYTELGDMSLRFLVEHPDAAMLLGKFGSNEEAFGITLTDEQDFLLRVHYYTGRGATNINPEDLTQRPVDITKFGTPHNHVGDISAVVPIGGLSHHLYRRVDGNEYTAGGIQFISSSDPSRSYRFRSSIFVPQGNTGLDHVSSETVRPDRGYFMDQDSIHVVSWEAPTITVFMNDFYRRRPGTVFQQGDVPEELERPRTVTEQRREQLWQSLVQLVESTT